MSGASPKSGAHRVRDVKTGGGAAAGATAPLAKVSYRAKPIADLDLLAVDRPAAAPGKADPTPLNSTAVTV